MAGSTDISRFYAQLARERRKYVSTSEHRKVAPGIKLDTLGKKMIKKELTTAGGYAHTATGGLSDTAKRRIRLATRRQLAKKEGLSDMERKRELSLYMEDVEKLWGAEGSFTKKAKERAAKGEHGGAKGGFLSGLRPGSRSSPAERAAQAQSSTISAGRSVAGQLRTGTDRDGNRVSYAADRGASSASLASPSSAPTSSSSSSRPRFSPPSGGR